MKVLPTLQIRQGRSWTQGEGLPSGCPREQVAELLACGFQRFGFVDVDAAQGTGNNRELIGNLIRLCRAASPRVCIQVGGGIRGSDVAQFYLDQGATWLLLGTVLHRSPMAVDQLLARFHEHLTAAIDARGGDVRAHGWEQRVGRSVAEVARHIRALNFRRILFADIPSAAGQAPDLGTARVILEHARLPLIMWSTFRHEEDLAQAAALPGLQGVQVDAAFALGHAEALKAHATPCS